MRSHSSRVHSSSITGNVFFGIVAGLVLEYMNIFTGGTTLTLPNLSGGAFRLHHVWIGLLLLSFGVYVKAPFFIGLGAVLMVGDWIEHQKPDGTVAPFW